MLIVDRSFSNLENVSTTKLRGIFTSYIYNIVSCFWRTPSDIDFIRAPKCFKIVTCDPKDDTIDLFASLPAGIAQKTAKNKYN